MDKRNETLQNCKDKFSNWQIIYIEQVFLRKICNFLKNKISVKTIILKQKNIIVYKVMIIKHTYLEKNI